MFYEKGTKTRHREEQCGGTPEISTAVCWWGLENRPVVELLCRPEHVVISGSLWKHLDLVASKNTAAFNRETCVDLNTFFFQNVFTTSIMWPSRLDDSDSARSCIGFIKGCVLPPIWRCSFHRVRQHGLITCNHCCKCNRRSSRNYFIWKTWA